MRSENAQECVVCDQMQGILIEFLNQYMVYIVKPTWVL